VIVDKEKRGKNMKRATIISLVLILGLCLVAGAFAADKDAIKKQVDEIVVSIDSGKKAQESSGL
jgi:low affinity Fe/Cu permease